MHSASILRQRPPSLLVGFVVGVVPVCAAAVAEIAGDGHFGIAAHLFEVPALLQLDVAGCTAPIALYALAGFAQGGGFGLGAVVWGCVHVGVKVGCCLA